MKNDEKEAVDRPGRSLVYIELIKFIEAKMKETRSTVQHITGADAQSCAAQFNRYSKIHSSQR